jgi:hypothetical protein
VTRLGSTYFSHIYPVTLRFGSNGYFTYTGVIKTVTKDGMVAAESIMGTLTNHGGVGISVPSPACGALTYSAFGTSPPVVAPPAADVSDG